VIGACRDAADRWFTGVVCASGTVARPGGPDAATGGLPAVDATTRAAEQVAAADLGGYGAVVLLGHPSDGLRASPRRDAVVEEVADLVARCAPATVLTHDLADRHATHVAVAGITVDALRRLPAGSRPGRLLACEGWRSLDWLAEGERVHLDVTGHEDLAVDLLAAHASQVAAKRYDRAAAGRRRANATFADPLAPDDRTEVVLAMDLTPLVVDDRLDPVAFLQAALARSATEAGDRLRALRPRAPHDGR
jgi:LmbE family N-acetylglucosaminyl deacetylase